MQMDTMSNEAPMQVPLLGQLVQKDWSHGHRMDDHNIGPDFWQERSVTLLMLFDGTSELRQRPLTLFLCKSIIFDINSFWCSRDPAVLGDMMLL